MMTAEQLKNSILQLAMQGKLVEQRPAEGNGEDLYKEIIRERQKLVKEGKIKKEKVLEEKTEEAPFDIPDTWKWAKLNDIVAKTIKRGKSPKYTQKSNILVFAQKCNTKAGFIDLSLCLFLDENQLSKYPEEEFMINEDIVINSTGNGTLGRVGIYKDSDNPERKPVVPDSHVTVIRCNDLMDIGYVFYCLKYYQPYMEKLGSGSTNQTELGAGVLKELFFPLPPLAEQKRIVAKIEELMPFVEQYAAASTKLNTLNTSFPEMMKKSILQEAVQGKLVPQDPNDEAASVLLKKIAEEKKRLIKEGKIKKQKPLPEIAEDEIPFEIPESWEWVRVGSYFVTSSGTTPSKSNSAYYDQKDFNWVRTTDLNNGILDKCEIQVSQKAYEECRLEIIPQDSVCIAMYGGGGTIGKNALIKFDTTINQSVCAIHPNGCNMKYVQLYMQHIRPRWMDYASGSRKDPNINQIIIKNCLIPIPPVREQKRIVEIVTKLMDRIEQM